MHHILDNLSVLNREEESLVKEEKRRVGKNFLQLMNSVQFT